MNKIDIEKKFNNMLDNVANENSMKSVDDYMNNFNLNVSLVNIDSRYRNKYPQYVIDTKINNLSNNPLTTTENSNMIKLNINNHPFTVGDKIVLQNINARNVILNNPIYLLLNFNYIIVNMNNHGILLQYTTQTIFNITITSYETLTLSDAMFGNIPVNYILGLQQIYIYDPTDINSFISLSEYQTIVDYFNISSSELQENYFFIKLPFNYNNTVNTTLVYNIPKIFEFQFMNIGGIDLPYLNANYPINYLNYQSYQEIIQTDSDNIYFNSSVQAIFTETNGGTNIIVGKIINSIEGYPKANQYTIELKKCFTDIVRIELVTTEIPYVDFNIKNNISTQNNKLYWQYLNDGTYIYSTSIDEGNYTPQSLITAIQTKMNSIPRIISTSTHTVYNLFSVVFNSNTQEVQFIASQLLNLPNSLTAVQNSVLGNDIVELIITQPNNFINIGDTIVISGAQKIGDVSSALINTTFTVHSVNKNNNTYSVLITLSQTYQHINLEGNGGINVTIKNPTNVSFLFNYPDTIGNILGFKYVGQNNAITPFNYIVSNFNDYILKTPYDDVGNNSISNSLLNLTGSNYYMLLYLNDYEGIMTNVNIMNAFSKILMMGNSGDIMFNTFINSPLEFDIPVSTMDEIKVSFLYPDGSQPDFRNFDHSFTLRITERHSTPVRTGLNSKKITRIEGLEENAIL